MASVATLGSHCALQVLKGAKDEGLKTLLVCEKKRERLYKRFDFIDELILVDSFEEDRRRQRRSAAALHLHERCAGAGAGGRHAARRVRGLAGAGG